MGYVISRSVAYAREEFKQAVANNEVFGLDWKKEVQIDLRIRKHHAEGK